MMWYNSALDQEDVVLSLPSSAATNPLMDDHDQICPLFLTPYCMVVLTPVHPLPVDFSPSLNYQL